MVYASVAKKDCVGNKHRLVDEGTNEVNDLIMRQMYSPQENIGPRNLFHSKCGRMSALELLKPIT